MTRNSFSHLKNQAIGTGYLRKDGRIGIRNRLLILYTSPCAEFAARKISQAFSPNTVEVLGFTRNCTSSFTEMKLKKYLTHPNIRGALFVSHCSEGLDSSNLLKEALLSGRCAALLSLDHNRGIANSINQGLLLVKDLLASLSVNPSQPLRFSDLIIGAECGGSDFTSGISANPLVGRLFDMLVDLGSTVLFEEMYEAVGLKDYLISRCQTAEAAREISCTYDKFLKYSKEHNQFFITPGNMKGGLTTIEEKSMGTVSKSGSRPIQGVVKIGQIPKKPGLWLMDSMSDTEEGCGPYISEDATSLLVYPCCGTILNILTSGRGHLINTPVTPTLKITGNRETYSRLSNDIDFDTSPMLYGEKNPDELADALLELVLQTINGQLSKGEALGHRDGFINHEKQFSQIAPYTGGIIYG